MSKKRILFVAMHYPNRAPGQRFRFEQYFSYLEKHGYECHLSNLIDEESDKFFYSSGNTSKKLSVILSAFKKRLNDALNAKNYAAIFVFREVFMMRTFILENLFCQHADKLMFDFDDSVWLPNVSKANEKFVFIKSHNVVPKLISHCKLIVAGNPYLKEYASQYNKNITIIPTTIDVNEYVRKLVPKDETKVCIGWSGSVTTIQHFKTALPFLRELKIKYGDKICFQVIGDKNYVDEELGIKGVAWKKENELEELSKIDIGIMPLPDDQWAKGKCALKGLQYMALEIPTIMSPVGVNVDVIKDGVNGYLATDENEWLKKLELLINDATLRKQIGAAGRKTVVDEYSIEANQDKYLKAFDFVTGKSDSYS